MSLLLDTHSFIWFITDNSRITSTAREAIEIENQCFLSIASIWEMAIKVSLGKLEVGRPLSSLIPLELQKNKIQLLTIEISHTLRVSELPFHHRDPFDRMIIAQSLVEDLLIVGKDSIYDNYGVSRLW